MYYQTDYEIRGFSLVSAAAKGEVGRMRACLDSGANIHFENDLALRAAAFTGNFATLEVLVEKGGNLHANDDEALLYAAKRGDKDMTRYLLSKGADAQAMLKKHEKLVDDECLATLDGVKSEKLSDAFNEGFSSFKAGMNKFKKPSLRANPPPRP